ncbi:MAG TPA: hypothetical protein VGM51_03795 [Armatimonadota bacterium]
MNIDGTTKTRDGSDAEHSLDVLAAVAISYHFTVQGVYGRRVINRGFGAGCSINRPVSNVDQTSGY